MAKIIPVIFLSLGLLLLIQVSLPVVNLKIWEVIQTVAQEPLTSPQQTSVLGVSIQNTDNFPLIVSSTKRETVAAYSYFTISIPSIKLKDELVHVDSNDLSKGLIHLPGSSLPGEKGNLFISGHSALPLFFLGNDKRALFAKLPNIKTGDVITVSALGTKFTYEVTEIKIVKPEDMSVILPPDNIDRYISLMTCFPPGLNTKRLVVIGKLI